MPLVIDATVGGTSANSYCTVAEVLSYAEQVFPASEAALFLAAAADDQKRAMIAAAQLLDQLRDWLVGWRADATQAREFPRLGTQKADRVTPWDDDVIPPPVKNSQARLAFFLMKQATTEPNQVAGGEGTPGLTSISFGSELSMTFDGRANSNSPGQQFLASQIYPMLGNLLRAPQPRVVRG